MTRLTGGLIGRCPHCQTAIHSDHPYAWCSKCGNALPDDLKAGLRLPTPSGVARAAAEAESEAAARGTGPRVLFRKFVSSFRSWDELFAEAAAFATGIGRERLVNISHSEDQNEGVVTVWYWSE
ncbi:MAG TPA: hypothetical protein VF665_08545 [Longimicrobium sp.]|jgi:hypothetical protein|uniref:hypothetical protein n=1 Tax=Longimicrobium sp. TaxID=2029185 RepID=UPI002EDA3F4E